MKLDKKTLIIGALVIIGGLWFFTGKADAQEVEQSWSIDAEVGNYEKRIDGGVYTADDANYLKASTELGVIGGLGLTADVEYVDSDAYQLYTTVGTVLDTPFGDLSAGILFSNIEDGGSTQEFVGAYDVTLPFVNLDAVLDLGATTDGEYTVDLTTEVLLVQYEAIDLIVGAAYGQSFEYETDYSYTLGYARVQLDSLYAQFNYLNNDLYGDSYEATTDFGLAFSF